jgi:hypothetical protein
MDDPTSTTSFSTSSRHHRDGEGENCGGKGEEYASRGSERGRVLQGTEALRHSQDPHNPSLTFSIITHCTVSVSGYTTLDIECTDKHTYKLLYRGFNLLLREAQEKRSIEGSLTTSERMRKRMESIASLWSAAKNTVIGINDRIAGGGIGGGSSQLKSKLKLDPVNALYEPASGVDPLQYSSDLMLRVFSPGAVRRKPPPASSTAAAASATTTVAAPSKGKKSAPKSRLGGVKSDYKKGSHEDEAREQNRDSDDDDDDDNDDDKNRRLSMMSLLSCSPLKSNSNKKRLLPPAQFLGWYSAGTQIWARLVS